MIQRIQTVWWLVSAAAMGALIFMPLFEISIEGGAPSVIHGTDIIYIYGPLIGGILLTTIAIFFFKNRPFQVTLGYIAITNLVGIGVGIVVCTNLVRGDNNDLTILPWTGLLLIAIIFQILAIRAVKKDEALVRSMDRLR